MDLQDEYQEFSLRLVHIHVLQIQLVKLLLTFDQEGR